MALFSQEADTCATCLEQEFTLEHDLIRDPGKFEGEPLAAYHAYHTYLDGGVDEEVYFMIGMVSRIGNVLFEESDQGFVYSTVFDTEEEAIARIAELEAKAESELEEEEESN